MDVIFTLVTHVGFSKPSLMLDSCLPGHATCLPGHATANPEKSFLWLRQLWYNPCSAVRTSAVSPNLQNLGDISNKSLWRLHSEMRLTLCLKFHSGCKLQHRCQRGQRDHVSVQCRWQIPDDFADLVLNFAKVQDLLCKIGISPQKLISKKGM